VNLQDIEVLLKRYWEGLFKKGAGPVQPVEIARSLVREMNDKRRVSVSRVYAPNVFTVYIGSADFEQSAPLQAPLAQEMGEHILVQAEEKGFTLIGKPEISFEEDQALGVGALRIESLFNASVDGDDRIRQAEEMGSGRTGLMQRIDHTMIFGKKEPDGREPAGLYLTVIQGPDMGKIFSLGSEQQALTIGRKMTNNIYLTDINASREHARVEWREGALFLKDLGSRNGTFLNAERIEERQIGVGDLVQIGENVLQLEEG
jgi:hypothetical protein